MDLTKRKRAPLTVSERNQLKTDATNIRAAAERKGATLNKWEEAEETAAASQHFELGCWLYYYSRRIYTESIEARIDCARRLFVEGFTNPGYQFFTIFDFGERQLDTLFEMGDAYQVIEGLRRFLATDRTGNLRTAFAHFGWPITAPDLLST